MLHCQDKPIAKGWRYWPSRLQQCFQVGFRRLLKTKNGLAPVASVCVTAGQELGFGDPNALLIPAQLDSRDRDDHDTHTISDCVCAVNSGVRRVVP